MRIVLVEPNLSGHHKLYLITFKKILLQLGHEVSVISTDIHFATEGCKVRYTSPKLYFKKGIGKKLNVFYNLFLTVLNLIRVRCIIRKKDVDIVFFCCFDDYMNELMPAFLFDWVFPIKTSGLLLKARTYKGQLFFDRRNILKADHIHSIATLEEFAEEELNRYIKRVVVFPDFADPQSPNKQFDLANLIVEKARGRKIVIVIGALDMRKGIKTFVECAKLLPKDHYYFVMAGKAHFSEVEDAYVKQQFDQENGLYYPFHIPTEADFNRLIEISHVIFAAYVNFPQSSNMLAKAAIFKKPLIVSAGYYMEAIVEKYGMGYVIDQDSVSDACCVIKEAVEKWHYSPMAQKYLDNNSIHNLNACFDALLNS